MTEKGPQPNRQVLSNATPTDQDRVFRDFYLQSIKHTMEDEKEAKMRESVLVRLDQLLKSWIREEALKKGFGKIFEATGRLYSSGSYRMGVHGTGDDIDVILVVPRFITSADFFDSFYGVLQSEKDVDEIHRTPSARQPIISLTFSTIKLDLQLASLMQNSITRTVDIFDTNILRGLDPTTIRTLSGPSVADRVLRFVPKIPVFRELLRGVKAWARARGIYSSRMSYMGGVALAVLSARVCQLYPNSLSFKLLCKFFSLYSNWFSKDIETRKNQPIYLTTDLNVMDSELQQLSWDSSKKPRDAAHIFPVITPALPYQNTCAQVTKSSLKVICDELTRGNNILKYLIRQIGSETSPSYENFIGTFQSLFEETEFFVKYKYFLRVCVSVRDRTVFHSYASAVESRLGSLLRGIEKNNPKLVCHLYPRGYQNQLSEGESQASESFFYIGMEGDFGKGQVDLRQGVQDFKEAVQYLVKSANYPPEKVNEPKLSVLEAKDLPASVLDEAKKAILHTQLKRFTEIQVSVEQNKTPQKPLAVGLTDQLPPFDPSIQTNFPLYALESESTPGAKRFRAGDEDSVLTEKEISRIDVQNPEKHANNTNSEEENELAKALATIYGD